MRRFLWMSCIVLLALALSACAQRDSSAPDAAPATNAAPTGVSASVAPTIAVVANTGGAGVYLRRTPRNDDRLRAWNEGTRMTVSKTGVTGDGMVWSAVTAPDGSTGFVPSQFLADPSSAESPDRLVATYFYYWYDLPKGPHSTQLTDRPADPSTSYRNVDWFKRQFTDMVEAGIDIALAVYWGEAEPSSGPGLVNMAKAVNELRAEGKPHPSIAIFLDTGAVAQWQAEQRDLTRPANRERFYGMIKTFYQTLPRDQWATIDGKAVLWMWAAWFDIKFDRALFDYLSEQFAKDFGMGLYVVGDNSWRYPSGPANVPVRQRPQMPLDSYYQWGAGLLGFVDLRSGVAQVSPGFDERPLKAADRTGRFAERQDGRYYEQQLAAAVASQNRIMAIETWNEFHEASEIAETIEYGRAYIDLTRTYTDLFKRR